MLPAQAIPSPRVPEFPRSVALGRSETRKPGENVPEFRLEEESRAYFSADMAPLLRQCRCALTTWLRRDPDARSLGRRRSGEKAARRLEIKGARPI